MVLLPFFDDFGRPRSPHRGCGLTRSYHPDVMQSFRLLGKANKCPKKNTLIQEELVDLPSAVTAATVGALGNWSVGMMLRSSFAYAAATAAA